MLCLEVATFNNLSTETFFPLICLVSLGAVGGWAQGRARLFLCGVTYSKVVGRRERDDLIFHQSRRNMASAGSSTRQQQRLLR